MRHRRSRFGSQRIAHELRPPLTSIRGFIQYLQGSTDPKEWQEYGDIIVREVDSLNRIVSELLDLVRQQPPHPVHSDLNRLVKAALLYADHVTLVSPKMAMLEAASSLVEGTEDERTRRLLDLIVPLSDDPRLRPMVQAMRRRKGKQRPPGYLLFEAQLLRTLAPSVAEAGRVIEGFRDQPGVAELNRARHAGVLDLDGLGIDPAPFLTEALHMARGDQLPRGKSSDLVVRLMLKLSTVIGPSALSYPMFDQQVTDFLRSAESEGRMLPLDPRAAKEPHLAASFIGRMKTFPDAQVDEILDVRRELADPLTRFRSAVAGMAREMEETPVDAEFPRTADALYRETVAPALLEIDELEHERGYGAQLARQIKSGPVVFQATSGIVLAATAYAALPAFGLAAAGLGAALSIAGLATQVERERQKLAKQKRANKFLFLAEAGRRLGN